tara:strand:+ start:476 stop:694 length:219 start_codon:yes stop_codon:yes gene_type:complete
MWLDGRMPCFFPILTKERAAEFIIVKSDLLSSKIADKKMTAFFAFCFLAPELLLLLFLGNLITIYFKKFLNF